VQRLKEFSGHDIELFCVASELEDIEYLNKNEVEYCVYPNKPLSAKFQFGFENAIKKDFDYLLTLGSDDLIDHDIFKDYYNELMQGGNDFFGLKEIVILDSKTLQTVLYKYLPNKHDILLGAGRMLSKKLCDKLVGKNIYNVRPKNNGLDMASETELKKFVKPTFVKTNKPRLIDVKSEVNIWSFRSVGSKLPKLDYDRATSFISIQEDEFLKTKEVNIVAVIPVHGRLPLLKYTIRRLIEKNKVFKVICVGSEDERETCENEGAEFILHENSPLGKKWNAGFMAAKKHNPDGCLFVGSSDWISDNWITHCSKFMNDFDLIGKPDFYLLDYGKKFRMCHWAGYNDFRRRDEPIGIGRILSKRILDKMDWKPMQDKLESSLDWSMYQRVLGFGGRVKLISTDEIKSLSLSTDKWSNKHNFESHWANKRGVESTKILDHDTFLKQNFEEAFEL
jgi:hypothetical protein